jgi:hypothetical protein
MHYPKQDHQKLGQHYLDHLWALTFENLHAKSEIAAQLAWRDQVIAEKQAQIDRLMLEYCPDEMTPEQMAEWARHQKPVSDSQKKLIDACLAELKKQPKIV